MTVTIAMSIAATVPITFTINDDRYHDYRVFLS